MLQDQNLGPFTGLVQGIAAAFGNAMAKVAVLLLSLLVAPPMIASTLLLWAGLRWPSFGRSIIANCIAGVVVTVLVGLALIGILQIFNDHFVGSDTFYAVFP